MDAHSPAPASFLARWRRVSGPDRALLCEALILLAFARVAIALLRFETIARISAPALGAAVPAPQDRAGLRSRVRWAVRAGARHVPFKAVCFQQGLAAQLMLRRRGVPSVMYYGAAPAPDKQAGLAAHVWVSDDGVHIVGGENVAAFAVLITFPAQPVRPQPA